MNQILFSVIGFLMFAIVGIGAAEVKIQMAEQGRLANQERESSENRSGAEADSDSNSDSRVRASATANTSEAQVESAVALPPTTVPEALSQVVRTVSTALTSDWGDDSSESRREDDDEYEDEDEWEDEDEEYEKKQVTTAPKTSVSSGTQPSSGTTQPAPTTPTAASFTMAQIATHNSAASCYSVVEGAVYDLTSFVSKHPGGQSAIKSMCGVDGTAAFSGQHGGQGKPSTVLAQYKIGVVQ